MKLACLSRFVFANSFELPALRDVGDGGSGVNALPAVGLAFYLVVLGLVDRGGAWSRRWATGR